MSDEKPKRTLHEIAELVAEKLPYGWKMQLEMETGYAGVVLEDPDGDEIPLDDYASHDDDLVTQIEQAIMYGIDHDSDYPVE